MPLSPAPAVPFAQSLQNGVPAGGDSTAAHTDLCHLKPEAGTSSSWYSARKAKLKLEFRSFTTLGTHAREMNLFWT